MVELKFDVKKQNILVLLDRYDVEKSKQLADSFKARAFGVVTNIKKLFDKKDDIVLTYVEKRYEPFWHIKGESYLEYKRKTMYGVEVKPEVRSIMINNQVFETSESASLVKFSAEDHCFETYEEEILVDASSGKDDKILIKYAEFESRAIKQTEELMGKNKVVIPAEVKASFLIREMIKKLIKPFHADKIIREAVEVKKLALYFRPIYTFEYTQNLTGVKKVLEVDALSGEVKKGGKQFKESIKELVPENALFDVGTELASMVIPGAGFAAFAGKTLKARHDKKRTLEKMKSSLAARQKGRK